MKAHEQQSIFAAWLEKHRGLLFKVVRAYTVNAHDSDDLFQEIAIQLWNSIPNFKGASAETTWIYRVAFYAASTWAQKERTRHQTKQSFANEQPSFVSKSSDNDPRLDWLYERISQMDEPDRSLTLLLLDGYQYKDMADILGLSLSNVGVRINRIKKLLTQESSKLALS